MKLIARCRPRIFFAWAIVCTIATPWAIAQQKASKAPPTEQVIEIKRGQAADPLREHPLKKVKLQVDGTKAKILDIATEKPIGKELSFKETKYLSHLPFKITCWSFSPDGKLIALGSGYKAMANFELEVNYGQVCIWDISSGKLVAKESEYGTVKSIAFSEDGMKVLVEAEDLYVNGK